MKGKGKEIGACFSTKIVQIAIKVPNDRIIDVFRADARLQEEQIGIFIY